MMLNVSNKFQEIEIVRLVIMMGYFFFLQLVKIIEKNKLIIIYIFFIVLIEWVDF